MVKLVLTSGDRYAQAVEGQSSTFAPVGLFDPK